MTAHPVAVATAQLERAGDGTPFSSEFRDIYHSAQGGLAQARHVFIAGNGLPARWAGRECFVVVETGFGLGLNFLATWAEWRRDPARPRRLHFVSVEHRPFARDDLAAALVQFDELQPLARALVNVWPAPIAGFHRMQLDAGNVLLTLLLGDARELLPQLVARADAFYLDGFAPARNPEIWSPDVVRELSRLAAPGATLATWTVAGGVRAALGDAGFALEKRAGFGDKREMLVGTRAGHSSPPAAGTRHAVVVGAGLAGCLAADRLASRGWEIELVDARTEASVSAVGAVRPVANLRDAVNAQVSRSAFLHALQFYRALQHDGYKLVWNRCGILQLADEAEEAARFEAIVRSQGYPATLLQSVDVERARELAGYGVGTGGWYFPDGALVSPRTLAAGALARAGDRVRRELGRGVARVDREGAFWRALDADDRVIAQAPLLVLANAADIERLVPEARLRLSTVRGQVTYLPPSPGRTVSRVVSGNGFVAPLPDGGHAIGATYQHDDFDPTVRAADHRDNLERAESLLPGFTRGLQPTSLGGWTGFRTTVPDRLPIFGESAIEGVCIAGGL
ncbi:MAG TPA: bifunctional tRNA (5-methylaminomethyl-2-thiouridine)(34)-methyltransferase MnmD/FAD-dependent 5-carboxymethylaminomethyl-2-thiouridine(34) oxidoreductase MnmC, partial [Usitatibacter sp.]|nr:bifunctional tRNA (5-methylaminomethyl-2-thiouridine)(34)-methyltransferase MnmD/FAD-dependent 5-carboxymethylaminomethyl-2-thiouridine(34) oxidoreductase MnmC [Usitatibacter sp.]